MKAKLQRLLRPLLLILGGVGIIAALGFVEHSTDRAPVKELRVQVDAPEGVHFIDENAVREQVLADGSGVIGSSLGTVDARRIESSLRGIACVRHADVYHTMDGVLHVNVQQREPIVRVINADGSGFYIDKEGWTMPLSDTYTARVLVVTGQLFEPFAHCPPVDLMHESDSLRISTVSARIHALARTITADPFWNALIDQVDVDATGEFDLLPRVGGARVKVGRGDDLLRCLEKLRTFYAEGIPQADWRRYSVIDTRFADQVVCTKRTTVGGEHR